MPSLKREGIITELFELALNQLQSLQRGFRIKKAVDNTRVCPRLVGFIDTISHVHDAVAQLNIRWLPVDALLPRCIGNLFLSNGRINSVYHVQMILCEYSKRIRHVIIVSSVNQYQKIKYVSAQFIPTRS